MSNAIANQDRRWMSLSEAADYCGLNEKSIRRYISAGKLQAFRLGSKSIRLDKSEVDALFSLIPAVVNP